MNLLKILLFSSLLIIFTSCANLTGKDKSSCCKKADHSCCTEKPECKDGNCKADKSCCENACGSCDGKKGDCGKSCELKGKKSAKAHCKDGSCDMKKKKSKS